MVDTSSPRLNALLALLFLTIVFAYKARAAEYETIKSARNQIQQIRV